MDNIKFYEVSEDYVDYLVPHAPHLFRNKKQGQQNSRKYIGVVLHINEMNYFAPLSSFKDKYHKMNETLDLIKIKNYSVINLNNMFPVPEDCYFYVDISKECNLKYKSLLLYNLKIKGQKSALTNRCNDFLLLEELCKEYK